MIARPHVEAPRSGDALCVAVRLGGPQLVRRLLDCPLGLGQRMLRRLDLCTRGGALVRKPREEDLELERPLPDRLARGIELVQLDERRGDLLVRTGELVQKGEVALVGGQDGVTR